MRRETAILACLVSFLLCFCTRILSSRAAEGGVQVESDTSGEDSSETASETGDQPQPEFPLQKFEHMFNKLAREVGLSLEGSEDQLHAALERLFSGLPDPVKQPSKAGRQIQKGLLKKIMSTRMQREGSSGSKLNLDALMADIGVAMKRLQDFKLDPSTSPAQAIQQLAQLTKTSPEHSTVPGLQQYLEQSAKVLREILPTLSSDEEL